MKQDRKIRKNNITLFSLIALAAILGKIIQFNFLPEKYFYDSNHIIDVMNGSTITDQSYTFTANFFSAINIFNFEMISEWAIFLTILMTPLVFLIFKKAKTNLDIRNVIFILASTTIISIYTFNISKEAIQFIIFLLIFLLIENKKIKNIWKIILPTIILFIEGLLFRKYYIITALLFIALCIIYKQLKRKNITKTILLLLPLLIFSIFTIKTFSTASYSEIINARENTNAFRVDSEDAITIINDTIPNINDDPIIFMQNYTINTFRILFPVELLARGIKYAPFIIIQTSLFFIVFTYIKKYKNKEPIPQTLFIVVAFILTSILFEPDFGSVIRHESVILPILLTLLNLKKTQQPEAVEVIK